MRFKPARTGDGLRRHDRLLALVLIASDRALFVPQRVCGDRGLSKTYGISFLLLQGVSIAIADCLEDASWGKARASVDIVCAPIDLCNNVKPVLCQPALHFPLSFI